MQQELIDRIYEAAFMPDHWRDVLDGIAARSQSASGAVYGDAELLRFRTMEKVRVSLTQFVAIGAWRQSSRMLEIALGAACIVCDADASTSEQPENDSVGKALKALGPRWQVALAIPMQSDGIIMFTSKRLIELGRHDPIAVVLLDELRPHPARAGLLAASLGLKRAHTMVATLAAIGFPAAIVNASGNVVAVNELLETLPSHLVLAAYGRFAIDNKASDALLKASIQNLSLLHSGCVQSVPLPAQNDERHVGGSCGRAVIPGTYLPQERHQLAEPIDGAAQKHAAAGQAWRIT